MTPTQLIDLEIVKLRDERARLWEADCGSRDVQIVSLDAMIEALRWAKDPKAASDRFTTPFDEFCFKWRVPKPVMVPTPDPSEYAGTELERLARQN